MGKEYEPSPALEIDDFFFNALALQNELLREVGAEISLTERRCEGAPKLYPHINIPLVSKRTVDLLTEAGFIDKNNKAQTQTETTKAINRKSEDPTAMRITHYLKVRNFMGEHYRKVEKEAGGLTLELANEEMRECRKRFNQWAIDIVSSEKLAITNTAMQKGKGIQEQTKFIIQGIEQLGVFIKIVISRESDQDEKDDLRNALRPITTADHILEKIAKTPFPDENEIGLFERAIAELQ